MKKVSKKRLKQLGISNWITFYPLGNSGVYSIPINTSGFRNHVWFHNPGPYLDGTKKKVCTAHAQVTLN